MAEEEAPSKAKRSQRQISVQSPSDAIRIRSISEAPDDHYLRRQEARADRWQNFVQWQIGLILAAFLLANAAVLWLIHAMWQVQMQAPAGATPPPIITESVVLRLITATSAQLGALALGVGAALYRPGRR